MILHAPPALLPLHSSSGPQDPISGSAFICDILPLRKGALDAGPRFLAFHTKLVLNSLERLLAPSLLSCETPEDNWHPA